MTAIGRAILAIRDIPASCSCQWVYSHRDAAWKRFAYDPDCRWHRIAGYLRSARFWINGREVFIRPEPIGPIPNPKGAIECARQQSR